MATPTTKADIALRSRDVRFTPKSDRLLRGSEMTLCAISDQSAAQQTASLFGRVISKRKQCSAFRQDRALSSRHQSEAACSMRVRYVALNSYSVRLAALISMPALCQGARNRTEVPGRIQCQAELFWLSSRQRFQRRQSGQSRYLQLHRLQ